jgi:hypothetical protein
MPSALTVDQSPPTLQAHVRATGVPLVSSRQHRLADVVRVLVQAFLRSSMYASGSNNDCQAPPGYSGCRRVNSSTVSGRAEFKRPRTSDTGGRDFGGDGGGGGGGGGGSGSGNGGDDQHDRPGSDRVHTPGGRFRCPVYGKANNKTKNSCSLETFETEAEALYVLHPSSPTTVPLDDLWTVSMLFNGTNGALSARRKRSIQEQISARWILKSFSLTI